MGMQMNEHGEHWEAQRERLSAYLDDRLAPSERAELERHLPGCARCSTELVELRQVVALLGAMPAPRLPRSFALLETLPETRSRAGMPQSGARPSGSARRGAPAWTRVARWAGGLAAAAGFVLLVGSALAGFGGHVGGASSAASSTSAPATTHSTGASAQPTSRGEFVPASPSTAGTLPGRTNDQHEPATASASATAPAGTPSLSLQHGEGAGGFSIAPVDLPIAGAGLLVAGAATFTAGSVARRRAMRRTT